MSDLEARLAELSVAQRRALEAKLATRRRAQQAAEAALQSARDDENLLLVGSSISAEEMVARFYGRYPWPWPAVKFDTYEDPDFDTIMINQEVGDWRHRRLPEAATIWVAGCGVNQGVITALRFPRARVIGSDISVRSLDLCRQIARQVNVGNLELREESINRVDYQREFDYVICTGVIHHNAEPEVTLARLAAALKPTGLLELMVYNRFHRIITSAFQKAVRAFSEVRGEVDFEWEVGLAKRIVGDLPVRETLEKAFIQYMDWSESDFADLLVQPVEHSYTVESLGELAARCGLQFMVPCVSHYARHLATHLSHNLEVRDAELAGLYYALPDERRWQVTNLLLHDKSPLLWFYFQRRDAERPRVSERQVGESFLETRFAPAGTRLRSFVRDGETYRPLPETVDHPLPHPLPALREVVAAADPEQPMGEVLRRLGRETSWPAANRLRSQLATSAFPYLRAVGAGD